MYVYDFDDLIQFMRPYGQNSCVKIYSNVKDILLNFTYFRLFALGLGVKINGK